MGAALHELVEDKALDQVRMSMTLVDVLSIMKSPQSNFQSIAKSIQFDPGTTKKLLGKVNSPYFKLENPVRELHHAVSILGIRQVRELLLQATDRSFYHRFLKIESAMIELKKHTIAVACYAEELAKEMRQYMTNEFYEAGLLHDMGKFAILIAIPEDYLKIMKEAEEMNYSLYLHEKDQLGFNHVDVGVQMAFAWDLSETMTNVIRYHHEITEDQAESLTTRDARMVSVVSFANLMAKPDPRSQQQRSVYRSYASDLPTPPGDLSVNQLQNISDHANSRYLEVLRTLGFLN